MEKGQAPFCERSQSPSVVPLFLFAMTAAYSLSDLMS